MKCCLIMNNLQLGNKERPLKLWKKLIFFETIGFSTNSLLINWKNFEKKGVMYFIDLNSIKKFGDKVFYNIF